MNRFAPAAGVVAVLAVAIAVKAQPDRKLGGGQGHRISNYWLVNPLRRLPTPFLGLYAFSNRRSTAQQPRTWGPSLRQCARMPASSHPAS